MLSRRDCLTWIVCCLSGSTAGCSHISDKISRTPTSTSTNTKTASPNSQFAEFQIVLVGAPNGLQKYSLRVNVSPATFVNLDPGLIFGPQFRIIEGGEGHSEVLIQAADLAQIVGSFTERKPLVTCRVQPPITRPKINIEVKLLQADTGESIPPTRLSVASTANMSVQSGRPERLGTHKRRSKVTLRVNYQK